MEGKQMKTLLVVGTVALAAIVSLNLFYSFRLQSSLAEAAEMEELEPAEANLVVLEPSCEECYDIENTVENINESTIDLQGVERINADSELGQEYVNDYDIEELPNVLMKGEIDRIHAEGYEEYNGALKLESVPAPFVDVVENEVQGLVEMKMLVDPTCDECQDLSQVRGMVEDTGVEISSFEEADYREESQIVEEQNMDAIPALLISKEIDHYPEAVDTLFELGFLETDDYYIFESMPPYVEADTGEVRGLLDLTLIDVEGCEECYDVEMHTQIVEQFAGPGIQEVDRVDVQESSGLVEKYDIESAPTLVITGDPEAYPQLEQVWQEVGTIEEDGTFVFREPVAMGPYVDLETGEIVRP